MIKDKSIFIKNIYYMLAYAFEILNQGGYEDIAVEEFENIHNLFAAILAKGIGRQLKQGLYREYIDKKEDIAVVRGKIDMPGTIRDRLARKRVLTCEYDELSENNLLNQILKTTVMLLLRHAKVEQKYKDELKKEMLFFSGVDTVDPVSVRWSSIYFQRNNNAYRMLISLCRLILEGMLLTTDSGEYKLASFVDEQRMNRLYEKFILEYYAKECPQVTARASQIPWALDDGLGTMLPIMQSDITLTKDDEVLIIDAKYYTHTTQVQYDVHTLHSGNLYQIFPTMKPLNGVKEEIGVNKAESEAPKIEPEKIDFSKVEIEPLFKDFVDFETFSKSDFRAVKVLACEAVPKSKKLLKFTLDDGSGENRTILSGIHAYYEPEELVGKTCIAITNLPPRPMMGIDSCGMLISAVHHEEGEEKLHLLMVDDHIPAGAKLY